MSGLGRALVALGLAGFAWGLAYLAINIASDHPDDPVEIALLKLLVGWAFLYVGLFVWARRPENRMGMILTAVGLVWFLPGLVDANTALFATAGLLLSNVAVPVSFSLVAFPTGRIERRLDRAVIAGAWVWATLGTLVLALLSPARPDEPENLLAVTRSREVADAAEAAMGIAGGLLAAGLLVALALRWRASSDVQRRELAPVVATGSLAAGAFAVLVVYGALGVDDVALRTVEVVTMLCLASLAVAFLVGLVRARVVAGAAVTRLMQRLEEPLAATELRDLLAEALRDPSLQVLFPLPGRADYVGADGEPVPLPAAGGGRAVTPVDREGRRIAVIVHDVALDRAGDLVRSAAAASVLALENARLEAELRARVAEVTASRARIIAAGDEERRRLERDLHDGAQQRLVSLALRLRMARGRVDDASAAAPLLDGAMAELEAALAELRELARGIHPAVLTDRGLGPALEGLAARATVPVELEVPDAGRLPRPVEAAAYFVVSEALANVAKYSGASHARVRVERRNGHALVEVRDDGVGGADPARGSGLSGLSDRVAALQGRLAVESPVGRGTVVRAEIPCAS